MLIEALAAGAPIVASDLDAFARVLEDGAAGVLVAPGGRRARSPTALCALLADPARRAAAVGRRRDRWPPATTGTCSPAAILAVYETVLPPRAGR